MIELVFASAKSEAGISDNHMVKLGVKKRGWFGFLTLSCENVNVF